MFEKFANVVIGPFSGGFIQLTSLSFVAFGVELDFNTIAIVIGVTSSLLGLLISWRSAKVQKTTNLKELELAEKELRKLKIEEMILKSKNPELFKNEN
jgi:hypothetical protein